MTNIGEGDHLGISDIETPEKLAQFKRCIVEAVSKDGHAVLKADAAEELMGFPLPEAAERPGFPR